MGSALGQAHWPPPEAGATSGRWPTVPGVTHLIARAQMGPIRTPGGPPNPRGRVPHQRCSRALVTPPPPVGPCLPAFIPRGADPGPLLCPLVPAMSRLPLLPVPALACWCPWLLALCFFFVLSLSPRRPRPFCGWALELGAGGGGHSRCPPFCASTSEARRRHEARHLSLRWGGGGGLPCGSRRHPTLPAVAPPAVPPWGLARRVPPLGTVVSSLCLPTPPRRPQGGVRRPLPSSLLSPRLLPVALPSVLGGCGRWGRGGGGRPRCPSSRVSTSQARHWHAARHLSSCWGVRHAAWPLSSPCPRCVHSPGAPPAGEGGPLPAPPFLQPPSLGGAEACGGGALSFSCRCPRVAGTRRGSLPSAGGGGGLPRGSLRRPFYPTPAPPVVPPPGLAWRAPSTGTVVWLVPIPPSSASPPCRVVLGGGALFSPSLPAFALGGAVVLGGGGAPFSPPLRCTHVAGMS